MAVSFEDSYPSLVNTTQSAYDMDVEESNSEYNLANNVMKAGEDNNITLAQILKLIE